MSLSLALAGARGKTEKQMLKSLGYDKESAEVHASHEKVVKSLRSAEDKAIKMEIVNTMFIDKKYEIADGFLKIAKSKYQTEPQFLNFGNKNASRYVRGES